MKHIHYLEVRIEPYIHYKGLKTLKIKTKVNEQIYQGEKVYEDDDFEDRFHLLMRRAEEEIRDKVKEQK